MAAVTPSYLAKGILELPKQDQTSLLEGYSNQVGTPSPSHRIMQALVRITRHGITYIPVYVNLEVSKLIYNSPMKPKT